MGGNERTDLTFKLLPDDDDTIMRQSINGEPVMRITSTGFVIENWQMVIFQQGQALYSGSYIQKVKR